jgi:alpha-tubulin suppressor-like RCC1 family protein
VKANGTVLTWGLNEDGQLGLGDTTNQLSPTTIPGLTGVLAVTAGNFHSLSLKADGTLLSFGENGDGQLGLGDTTDRLIPTRVGAQFDVTDVSSSSFHTIALRANGSVVGWGNNSSGQLGVSQLSSGSIPVPQLVPGISNATQVATGGSSSVAVNADRRVLVWGDNSSGQLGNGVIGGSSFTPGLVQNLFDVRSVAVGSDHVLALLENGTVFAWGDDTFGQLGNGGSFGVIGTIALPTKRATPGVVPGLTNIVAVAAGGTVSFALRNDGRLFAWGSDNVGQLGDGDAENIGQTVPVALSLKGITQVATSGFHTLAVDSQGRVHSWGSNQDGQLGRGVIGQTTGTPGVTTLKNVKRVVTGVAHSIAIRDNDVLTWGSNDKGTLGRGTPGVDSVVPAPVLGLIASRVSAGEQSTVALSPQASGADVMVWGSDSNQALGVNPVGEFQAVPIVVPSPLFGLNLLF